MTETPQYQIKTYKAPNYCVPAFYICLCLQCEQEELLLKGFLLKSLIRVLMS